MCRRTIRAAFAFRPACETKVVRQQGSGKIPDQKHWVLSQINFIYKIERRAPAMHNAPGRPNVLSSPPECFPGDSRMLLDRSAIASNRDDENLCPFSEIRTHASFSVGNHLDDGRPPSHTARKYRAAPFSPCCAVPPASRSACRPFSRHRALRCSSRCPVNLLLHRVSLRVRVRNSSAGARNPSRHHLLPL